MSPELVNALGTLGIVASLAFLLVQIIEKIQEMAYRRLQMRQAELEIEEKESRKLKRARRK